jgi:hypothetical protein
VKWSFKKSWIDHFYINKSNNNIFRKNYIKIDILFFVNINDQNLKKNDVY